mgnify:CR=1 FL=1
MALWERESWRRALSGAEDGMSSVSAFKDKIRRERLRGPTCCLSENNVVQVSHQGRGDGEDAISSQRLSAFSARLSVSGSGMRLAGGEGGPSRDGSAVVPS